MAKQKTPAVTPSDFELQILGVLWENGPGTVRQVLDWLADGKSRAYTSVLSVMQVMQKKGLLLAEKQTDGLAHVFRPAVSRQRVVIPLVQGLISRIFAGRTQAAAQALLSADDLNGDEIDHLRRLLDELEARQPDS